MACPAGGWFGKRLQQTGLTDDFAAAMPMRNQQRRKARVGSLEGRTGGLGTEGLGKSYLGVFLGCWSENGRVMKCSVHDG
jgi:hypothetical protein